MNGVTLGRKITDVEKLSALDKIRKNYTNEPLDEAIEKYKVDEGMLWHMRIGHVLEGYLRKLQSIVPESKEEKFSDNILDCEICMLSKMKKLPFKKR